MDQLRVSGAFLRWYLQLHSGFESDCMAGRLSLRAPRGSNAPALPLHAVAGCSDKPSVACCLPLHSLAYSSLPILSPPRMAPEQRSAAAVNPSPQQRLHLSPPTNSTTTALAASPTLLHLPSTVGKPCEFAAPPRPPLLPPCASSYAAILT